MRKWVAMILIAALATMLFAGCSGEQQTEAEGTTEGTMEQAGQAVDQAVEETGDAVEGAVDDAGDAVQGAVDDATSK